VTTHHNNNNRNGLNTFESILNAGNFKSGFGATPATISLDAMVYAQPLYVSQVAWQGSTNCAAGNYNMVYVATENNTIYATQADSPFALCGSVSLNNYGGDGSTSMAITALPGGPCNNLTGSSTYGTVGITGTPVIDPSSGTLFAVSTHQVPVTPGSQSYNYTQRLNAINITSLAIESVLDLFTTVNGATPAGYPTFYVQNESQRAGLTATTNSSGLNIFVPWGTYCDANISSGGSFGIVSKFKWNSTTQFSSTVVNFYVEGTNTNLSKTPNTGNPAGVWMSGGAPAADAGGNIYVAIGNGNFEGVIANAPLNFGNSILKLSGSALAEEDYYTPNIWSVLNAGSTITVSCSPYPSTSCTIPDLPAGDWDLGSGGVVLLDSSSSTQYGEIVAAGKEGMFYVTFFCSSSSVCPTTNWNQVMGGLDGLASAGQGGYNTDMPSNYKSYACTPVTTALTPSPGNIAQCFYGVPITNNSRAESGERSTAAFWPYSTNATMYTVGTNDYLKAWSFGLPSAGGNGTFNTTPTTAGSKVSYPGASPSITSNGQSFSTAIVWVLNTATWNNSSNNQAVLTAYGAQNLTQLWSSSSVGGPGAVKFQVPTIANGKAYVAGQVSGNIAGCGSNAGCGGLLMIYY
jgi:hypothetical protein